MGRRCHSHVLIALFIFYNYTFFFDFCKAVFASTFFNLIPFVYIVFFFLFIPLYTVYFCYIFVTYVHVFRDFFIIFFNFQYPQHKEIQAFMIFYSSTLFKYFFYNIIFILSVLNFYLKNSYPKILQ